MELKSNVVVLNYVTQELAQDIWNRLPHKPDFWGMYQMPTVEAFFGWLQKSSRVIVFPQGILVFQDATPGVIATVHMLTWSAKGFHILKEHLADLAQIAKQAWGFQMLACILPVNTPALTRLVTNFGFTKESTIPNYFKFSKGWTDAELYSKLI